MEAESRIAEGFGSEDKVISDRKIFCVIVIVFYSPTCLDQETAKGPFGLQIKLPPTHLSTTRNRGLTLSF